MSRSVKVVVPAAVLIGGVFASSPFSFAKPDYMKKEQKACTYCHDALNKRDLNAMGKCYAEHGHSLEKCNPKRIAAGVW